MKQYHKKILIAMASIIFFFVGAKTSIAAYAAQENLPSGLTRENMQQQITEYIRENSNEAAVGVAVVQGGETIYESVDGYLDKENQITIPANGVFEWGSVTKLLTWVSVMQLEEQGKLDLEADIRTYIPEGVLKKTAYDKPITMSDLMNHTAGWQDSITNVYTDKADEIISLEEYVSKYQPEQIFEPGTAVAYSNYGVTLAGYIVECVSGENYCDYVRNHIFQPLGMNSSSINPLREDNEYVKAQLEKTNGYNAVGRTIRGMFFAPDYPAAGAAGTIQDMELFVKALLMKQNNPLFSKEDTVGRMLTASRYFEETGAPRNAHGFWFDPYRTTTVGHSGNTAQFSAHISLDPISETGVIVMTNQAQEMVLTIGVGKFVFAEDIIDKETVIAASSLPQITYSKYYLCAKTIKQGYCRFYNFFQIYKASEKDGHLICSSLMESFEADRISENRYVITDGWLKGYKLYMAVDDEQLVQKMGLYVFDLVPYSEGAVIKDVISYIMLGTTFFVSIGMLLSQIMKTIKKRKKFRVDDCAMCLLYLSIWLAIALEAIKLISQTATLNDTMIYIVTYAVIFLCCIADGIIRGINMVKTKKCNIRSVLHIWCDMAIGYFIIYWQLFICW